MTAALPLRFFLKKGTRVSPLRRRGGKSLKKPTRVRPAVPSFSSRVPTIKVHPLPTGPQPQTPHFSFLSISGHPSWAPPPQVHPFGCLPCQVCPSLPSGPLLRGLAASGHSLLGAPASGPPLRVPPASGLPRPLWLLLEAPAHCLRAPSLRPGCPGHGSPAPRPLSNPALIPRQRFSSSESLKPQSLRKEHTCFGPQVRWSGCRSWLGDVSASAGGEFGGVLGLPSRRDRLGGF